MRDSQNERFQNANIDALFVVQSKRSDWSKLVRKFFYFELLKTSITRLVIALATVR